MYFYFQDIKLKLNIFALFFGSLTIRLRIKTDFKINDQIKLILHDILKTYITQGYNQKAVWDLSTDLVILLIVYSFFIIIFTIKIIHVLILIEFILNYLWLTLSLKILKNLKSLQCRNIKREMSWGYL